MSVRVVARLRPLLTGELERDLIIRAESKTQDDASATVVRIPNPKNEDEDFTFEFNNVYDAQSTQEEVFQAEVAPTIKHLFKGFDVTCFCYGVTGTGKTHTMRGGKALADRGLIPRLLSGIYRKGRKIEKDSDGETTVQVSMSYYEIYNDRVYDLFEPPEKRTPAGLPLREQHGKTVVVGLTERPCASLKEFERLYDQANVNRSTSATKLNAHSSRSHAILSVKVAITAAEETRISTVSAIDLAGSEDNRRTDNGKDRLTESASINKSLFVLAQCVEAISKKQSRIPYRESKMTRILSLGQNQGLTVMILNLAPVRSYHLDSLSSLNFANRTKKIEVKEIENQPIFKGQKTRINSLAAASTRRQPLQLLANTETAPRKASAPSTQCEKPRKAFSVYADRAVQREARTSRPAAPPNPSPESKKRKGDALLSRPAKTNRQPVTSGAVASQPHHVSEVDIEQLVERKIEEALAARAMNDSIHERPADALSDEVQRRLDALEQRIEQREDGKSEGFNYLLMAKQHYVRGEEASALKMYQLALPYFPDNQKLASRMRALAERLDVKRGDSDNDLSTSTKAAHTCIEPKTRPGQEQDDCGDVQQSQETALSFAGKKRKANPSRLAPLTARIQAAPTTTGAVAASSSASRHAKSHHPSTSDATTVAATKTSSSSSAPDTSSSSTLRPAQMRPTASAAEHNHPDHDPEPTDPDTAGSDTTDPNQTPRTRHVLSVINSRDMSRIKLLRGVGEKKAELIVSQLNTSIPRTRSLPAPAAAGTSSSRCLLVDSNGSIDGSTNNNRNSKSGASNSNNNRSSNSNSNTDSKFSAANNCSDRDRDRDIGYESPSEEELHKIMTVTSLDQLAKFKGVGKKTVEGMRMGVGMSVRLVT